MLEYATKLLLLSLAAKLLGIGLDFSLIRYCINLIVNIPENIHLLIFAQFNYPKFQFTPRPISGSGKFQSTAP